MIQYAIREQQKFADNYEQERSENTKPNRASPKKFWFGEQAGKNHHHAQSKMLVHKNLIDILGLNGLNGWLHFHAFSLGPDVNHVGKSFCASSKLHTRVAKNIACWTLTKTRRT